ncbi:hypothetical protein AB4Z30_25340 [Paenibacillus sp. 2TAF8]|uniref:hypothetical protein n=1 Tax=Paenibacillus sp. 2TAF8 TaxID=3233020 RepID=UPI003F9D574B
MKFRKRILGVLTAALCMVTLGSSLTVNAAGKEEASVRSVLERYEAAAKKNDVDSMVQYSFDLSWPNEEQFKRNLTSLDEEVYKFETIALEKVETDLYKATVLAETEGMEETQMEVPVLNLNGKWKVIVGQDLEETQNLSARSTDLASLTFKSADFYKDYFTNAASKNNSAQIQALSGSVDYYSFSFSYVNSIYTDVWTNTNSAPTIKGYQEPDGGHGNWIDIDYQLRKKTTFSSSALSPDATVKFTGAYRKSGTWYEKQWYGIPTDTKLLMRISNNDNSYLVTGAGNVYN